LKLLREGNLLCAVSYLVNWSAIFARTLAAVDSWGLLDEIGGSLALPAASGAASLPAYLLSSAIPWVGQLKQSARLKGR